MEVGLINYFAIFKEDGGDSCRDLEPSVVVNVSEKRKSEELCHCISTGGWQGAPHLHAEKQDAVWWILH